MGVRFAAARAVSAVSTWGLKHVFRRPAANFPGKVALYADPRLIAHLTPRLREGSVVVVGTNGKTTCTNLLADVLEAQGKSVVCNRTGANLDSGVATSLLQTRGADWGVFESDELWLAKILPHLRAKYVLLLNLFRDQLDRCGEIDRIQESIIGALAASPATTLVYNADDPLCAYIASKSANPSIAFGVAESMGLAQNTVADAQMCQHCSSMFEYAFRQYGQLGEYKCPNCGFARPALDYAVRDARVSAAGVSFRLLRGKSGKLEGEKQAEAGVELTGESCGDTACLQGCGDVVEREESVLGILGYEKAKVASATSASGAASGSELVCEVRSSLGGAYMVYNLAAVAVASRLTGCTSAALQRAVDAFDPQNGRLQTYEIAGRRVLLNLAKNPTGFNQNLRIVNEDSAPKAVAFFINDKEADGRDISWIWDVDFEELANQNCVVYAGGLRKNDLQVRLKYAGVKAQLVDSAADVFAHAESAALPANASVYLIANYTALPSVHAELDRMAAEGNCAVAKNAVRADSVVAEGGAHGDAEVELAGVSAPDPSSARATSATEDVSRETSSESPQSQRSTEGETLGVEESKAPKALVDLAGAGELSGLSRPAGPAEPGALDAPLVIVHLFPDLLNLYGDGGNVRALEQRCRWRGIPVEVRRVRHGETTDLHEADLVFMGGGPDREQRLASQELMRMKNDLRAFVEEDGALLAICGGYQILGSKWLLGDEIVEGLSIVDIETRRPGTSANRLIDNIVLDSPLAKRPVVGYENHAGRTYLGAAVQPFGKVISSTGGGNNEHDRADGVIYRNLVGTYLHGPLLPKNPEVADFLLQRALEHRATRLGGSREGTACAAPASGGVVCAAPGSGAAAYAAPDSGGALVLPPLDDTEEQAANEHMCTRLGVK